MKRIFPELLIPIISVLGLLSCSDRPDETIRQLDEALSKKAYYEQNLLDRTKVLRDIMSATNDPVQIYDISKRIADEFRVYSMDSMVYYLQRNKQLAYEMGDRTKQNETDILLAGEYTMAGYYLEARELLTAIDPDGLDEGLLVDYWSARHSLAGESMVYSSDQQMANDLWDEREYYRNLLLGVVEPGGWEWHDLKREEADIAGDEKTALEHALALVAIADEYSKSYAYAAYFCYEHTDPGNEEERMRWLARSATADAMCGTRDYASLNSLSQYLFKNGDIDRAFRYTADHCMPDAIAFGGKLRPWQVAKFFPQIERAYQARASRQQRVTMLMVIILSCMMAVVLLLFIVLYQRQRILDETRLKLAQSYTKLEDQNNNLKTVNQKVMALNKELTEANKLKESFIGLFFSILSENINATRQYKNHVLRYIRQGSVSDLVDEIEDLPPIDEDIAEFYKMFDRIFLDLYPDFVEKFNALLQDGAAITPKGEDLLTPELRIFALIKMDITDSSKIAALLHYSVNTIYNYRAKIKNKARGDRDSFEDAVKAL